MFWVIAAVLVAVVPHSQRLPLWFLPMTLAVVGFRYISQTRRIKQTYKRVLVMLAVMVLLMIVYSQGLGLSREISVTILISMTVLKLLETYRMRDALLVVMLCYFVTVTRFLYSQDMLLIFYLFGSAYVATHALAVLNHEKNNRWLDGKQLKATAANLALAIPFAALFFLVFPRLGAPIWGSPDIFSEGKTGISDTMSPGSIIELFMDDSPAFRVTFAGDQAPPNNQMYWRGPVLWHFDGTTWSRQRHNRLRQPIASFNQDLAVNYQVELESTGQNYLFGLDYVTAAPTGVFLLPDSLLYSTTTINQLRHYELRSVVTDKYPEDLRPADRELLVKLPAGGNPRTQQLMSEWQSQYPEDIQLITQVLQWFNQEAFYYSYSPPPLSGEIIDQFLFDSRRGFCEHYASAFVVMMRMAGIPSRVVTGYQGGINNGEYWLIKQSDAHAWAEVYLVDTNGNGYWQRVDPTGMVAPERVEGGARELMDEKRSLFDYEWLISYKEQMDKYRYQWNQWVRDFNVNKQQALFNAIGIEHRDGKNLALMVAGILLFTALLSLIPLYLMSRRKYHELQKLYLQFARLAKAEPEIYAQHPKGLEHLAELIMNQYPNTRAQVEHFTQMYLQLRYGPQQARRQPAIEHLQKTLRNIKSKINAKQ